MTAATAKPRPRSARLAWLVALLLSAGVLAICLAFVWRGTSASATPKNPARPEQGVVCQLFLEPSGKKPVRCAAVLDAKPDAVWAVVTDYAHFGEIFDSPLWRVTITTQAEEADGRRHLAGKVIAPYAEYPFDVRILHRVEAERRVASWDENDGAGNATRGSWSVSPAEGDRTLVVYQQDVEAKRAPRLVVSNLLLAQLGGAVKRVKARVGASAGH